jgi:hypothetical protein
VRYEIRPISDPSRFRGGPRHNDTFKSSWPNTEALLCYEVGRLDGKDLVLEIDVYPGDLKVSGELKAYARPSQPGVAVAFTSKHGPLVYVCDRFHDWRANVRGIALGLEALRAVDRYGISGHGEQYTGWAQIEAGPSKALASTSLERAAAIISDNAVESPIGGWPVATAAEILADPAKARMAIKYARAHTHPDRRNGDRTAWDQVEQAAKVLEVMS